jgi:hypothetical protein
MRVGKMAMHLVSIQESPDPKTTFHTFHSLSRANSRTSYPLPPPESALTDAMKYMQFLHGQEAASSSFLHLEFIFIFNDSISGSNYMALNDVITSEKINWKNVKMVCRELICLFRHFHADRQEKHKNQNL